MARFTLILFAACLMGTGVASALDDAVARKESPENAAREELLAKIAHLEQQLAELKSKLKQSDSPQESRATHLTYTAPLTTQATPVPTPVPPRIFAIPEYQGPGPNGLRYPKMPNALRDPLSDMPKGTKAKQFNGMTVYLVPCRTEPTGLRTTASTVPGTTIPGAADPSPPHAVLPHSRP